MSKEQEKTVSDGQEKDASGASSEMDKTIEDGVDKKDAVSYESHKRLLGQLVKTKEIKEELESKLLQIEQEKQRNEEELLKKKGEWQKLFEQREAKIKSLQDDLETTKRTLAESNNTLLDSVKLHQFLEKLPGKIKNKDYLCHVDLNEIVVNPENGEIDEESINGVVNKFMDRHASLVDTSHVGKIPPGHPKYHGKLSVDDWKKLPLHEMKKNMKDVISSYKN